MKSRGRKMDCVVVKEELQPTESRLGCESVAVDTLKTELESVQEQLCKVLGEQTELKEELRVQKKRVLEETLARAQDGFTFKVKIDALLDEISRLTSLLERNNNMESAPPHRANKPRKQVKFELEQELTYEQKKNLCREIPQLSGPKLEKVIEIIGRVYPIVQKEREETEIEMDLLPTAVQIELYNFLFKNQ